MPYNVSHHRIYLKKIITVTYDWLVATNMSKIYFLQVEPERAVMVQSIFPSLITVTCFLVLYMPGPHPLGKAVLFSGPPKTLRSLDWGSASGVVAKICHRVVLVWQTSELPPISSKTNTTFSEILKINKTQCSRGDSDEKWVKMEFLKDGESGQEEGLQGCKWCLGWEVDRRWRGGGRGGDTQMGWVLLPLPGAQSLSPLWCLIFDKNRQSLLFFNQWSYLKCKYPQC